MRLSKRGEYGLRAMINLSNAQAQSPSAMVQIKDISAQEKIPTKYLEQILLALKNAGLLNSKMGIGGGYRWVTDVNSAFLTNADMTQWF